MREGLKDPRPTRPLIPPLPYGVRVAARRIVLEIAGREVTITNPDKVFFPAVGCTKLDLVRYYLAVAEGAVRGVAGRPMILKRFVHGAGGEPFYQKRAPASRPPWIETVELRYPSRRTADEVVLRDPAQLAWVVNLGCVDLNPHPVRADDLEHPDELRVDLDPLPGVEWSDVRDVAMATKAVLDEMGLVGWPKTSGSRGFHVVCRIERRWTFPDVRRAAFALARAVERRVPGLATSRWWKEERHGVFVDYNQNAKDRTTASVYSLRPTADARVSAPLGWDEVPDCEPDMYTMDTVPSRFAAVNDLAVGDAAVGDAAVNDPGAGIDLAAGSLEALLELAKQQKDSGLDDRPPRARRTMPLIEIARAASRNEALAGLERWKARHPQVWPLLGPADVLIDSIRGRSSTWTRLNLRNVPESQRPPQDPLTVDFDPWKGR